jgi:hypothetical protein
MRRSNEATMAESSIDLSAAAIEDIMAELKRRGLLAALYVSKGRSFYCTEDSGMYGTPAGTAALFCEAVQVCLNACDDGDPEKSTWLAGITNRLTDIQNGIWDIEKNRA